MLMKNSKQYRSLAFPKWLLSRMIKYQKNYILASDIEEVFNTIIAKKELLLYISGSRFRHFVA